MIGDLVQKLREKPKHTKDNIAFVSAATFTFVVFGVWAIVFVREPGTLVDDSKQGAQAFSTFFERVKGDFTEMKESLPSQEEIEAVIATSSVETENTITVTEIATTTNEAERRTVRIATTSSATSSATDAQ